MAVMLNAPKRNVTRHYIAWLLHFRRNHLIYLLWTFENSCNFLSELLREVEYVIKMARNISDN